MRKSVAVAVGLVCTAIVAPSVWAMGGGGVGGGGSYGGGDISSSQPTYSEYHVAVRLIKHQQYAEAIPHLESALADKPHDADILNYLGFTKRMVGEYDA